jgi:hypothetical protein
MTMTEVKVPYLTNPPQKFTIYKFEVNPQNPEISSVYAVKNLTSNAAYSMIPSNYELCDDVNIIGNDYYLVVNLRRDKDNICYYYVKKI